ncbi:hypothetical protein C8R46DRAFT_1048157 [Mycena filopes]|nr:hypothetical protein C8R46DRAFT_1048157 [Mycena filopes]
MATPTTKSRPQIAFPPPPSHPRPRTRRARLAHALLDFAFTALCAFVVLLTLLYLSGAAAGESPDASLGGVLRVTVACTFMVYGVVEAGAAVVRRVQHHKYGHEYAYEAFESQACDDEEGWEEVDGDGDEDEDTEGKRGSRTPFAMTPGRGRIRSVHGLNHWDYCDFVPLSTQLK